MSGYTTAIVSAARKHHAAGWPPSEIQRLLVDQFDASPSIPTIRRWAIPSEAQLERECTLRRNQRKVEQRRMAKLRVARDRGMSLKSLSIAASMFLGWELSPEQVKTRLEGRTGYKTKAAA